MDNKTFNRAQENKPLSEALYLGITIGNTFFPSPIPGTKPTLETEDISSYKLKIKPLGTR